jgi:hypothetical protein
MTRERNLRRSVVLITVLSFAPGAPSPARASTDPAAEAGPRSLDHKEGVGLPLLAGAIASVALPPALYNTPPACRWCDGASPNPVDKWAARAKWEKPCPASRLSYVSLGAAGAVALLPMSREPSASQWMANAGAVADSVAVTVMLTQVVKHTVRRARPGADACHPGRATDPDRNLSFFSGHAAIAFALVSSAHETNRLRGRSTNDWVWVGGGAAAATAYLRVAGGRHHLIDVLAGAGVGYMVGRWIPRHVTRPKEPEAQVSGPEFRSPPVFAYSRAVGGDGKVHFQVGKGPGKSVQFGLRF